MTLEININEEIYVAESIGEAMALIEKVIQKILSGEIDTPVNITIKSSRGNSPPTLGISIEESTKVGEALG